MPLVLHYTVSVPALAYMRPPELQQLALNFLATFFSRRHLCAQFYSDFFSLVVALNNNRHTSARAQKIFALPNMSIREPPPRPEGKGGPSAGSVPYRCF